MKILKILIWSISLLIIIGLIIFLSSNSLQEKFKSSLSIQPKNNLKAPTQPTSVNSNVLAHVFIIVEENKPFSTIVNNPQAPYINSLISQYSLATDYYGVAHPSLPNYLALTSGSTDGISTDCNPPSAGCEVNVNNIADQLKSIHKTWKEYAESMPSPCYTYNSGNYVTKHNPFIYYTDIVNNLSRCSKDVLPFSSLSQDLSSLSSTPNLAFITPNVCNDMHSCSIATGDTWLAQNVPMILNSLAFKTTNSILIITWDEGYASTNHIPTILIGPYVKKDFQSNISLNHYSILKTIDQAWNLPYLTPNVSSANSLNVFLTNG